MTRRITPRDEAPIVMPFIKYPREGTVKTRLAQTTGHAFACGLYRAFVADVIAAIDRSGCRAVIYFDPPGARQHMEDWLGKRSFKPQRGDTLGARMKNAFEAAFRGGATRAIVTGSDAPALTAAHIRQAFKNLATADAVIGPACDGGYYLIGFARERFTDKVFTNVRWSSPTVLQTTIDILNREGRSLHMLPVLRDIDTADDLAALSCDIDAGFLAKSETARYIRSMKQAAAPLERASC